MCQTMDGKSVVTRQEEATAEVAISALREIMSRLGLPLMMVSANGPCFKAFEFVEFC